MNYAGEMQVVQQREEEEGKIGVGCNFDAEIVWCQEEPMNMGAYSYIAPRLCSAMKSLGRRTIDDIKYVGRPPSASPATGFYEVHLKEQRELVHKAVQPEPID